MAPSTGTYKAPSSDAMVRKEQDLPVEKLGSTASLGPSRASSEGRRERATKQLGAPAVVRSSYPSLCSHSLQDPYTKPRAVGRTPSLRYGNGASAAGDLLLMAALSSDCSRNPLSPASFYLLA